ncbi:MAG: hypothetical protein IVW55_12050 [Chloroflexi bacterium]|nr:hypothetical protein [Chloroflexota bacterium]
MPVADLVPTAEISGSEQAADDATQLALEQAAKQVPELVDLFTASFQTYLQTLAEQPLPSVVDIALVFDTVELDPALEVLHRGRSLSGKDVWQALITPDIQQQLVQGVVQLIVWNLETAAPIYGPVEARLHKLLETTYLTILTTSLSAEAFAKARVGPSIDATRLETLDNQIEEALTSFPDLQTIYRDVAALSVEEVVRELSNTLTDGIIGYIVDVSDRTVRSWVSGKHKVQRADSTKLRVALAAVRALLVSEKPRVILRWFANENSVLDGDAPADFLREGKSYDWVIRAAASYALDGA